MKPKNKDVLIVESNSALRALVSNIVDNYSELDLASKTAQNSQEALELVNGSGLVLANAELWHCSKLAERVKEFNPNTLFYVYSTCERSFAFEEDLRFEFPEKVENNGHIDGKIGLRSEIIKDCLTELYKE